MKHHIAIYVEIWILGLIEKPFVGNMKQIKEQGNCIYIYIYIHIWLLYHWYDPWAIMLFYILIQSPKEIKHHTPLILTQYILKGTV